MWACLLVLQLLCHGIMLFPLYDHLNRYIHDLSVLVCRANLLRETYEIHKQGNTRVVYGAGCAVQRLLLGKEFVRLNVEPLPRSYTDETLRLKVVELVPAAEVVVASNTAMWQLHFARHAWWLILQEHPGFLWHCFLDKLVSAACLGPHATACYDWRQPQTCMAMLALLTVHGMCMSQLRSRQSMCLADCYFEASFGLCMT